jgi:predicted metal-dependent hydrolase
MFEYQLKESKRRRSVAIKVTDNSIVVYAPEGLERTWLEEWLLSKQSWVLTQRQKMKTLPTVQRPWHSNTIRVFGELYSCCFGSEYPSKLNHADRTAYVYVKDCEDTRACRVALLSLLRVELESYVMRVLPLLEEKMHTQVTQIKFREYKSRWGSCSSHCALTFNILLIGAKPSYIDYVIVHELAHCHILAHNAEFWTLVSKHYGEYKQVVKWFKDNGTALFIEKEA